MKKSKIAGLLAAACMLGCAAGTAAVELPEGEGKVLNIFAWSEDFRTYFETYYPLPEGVSVRWTIVPKVQGRYQDALDKALLIQDKAAPDQKIDLFMGDPDYLEKYVDSDVSQDIRSIGVTNLSNVYDYTIDACTSSDGQLKGAAIWLHPGVAVYRCTFAKEVLGTDEPEKVREAIRDWDVFSQTAEKAAEKELVMTPSYASTFLSLWQHSAQPWVDADAKVHFSEQTKAWIRQCEDMTALHTTQPVAIMDDKATEQCLAKVGKGLFFFGTDYYINSIMWKSQENRNEETTGDWRVCMGPAGYSKDDMYLMAAAGSDNETLVADVINTFLNNEEVCRSLAGDKWVFTNNKKVNREMAEDPRLNNKFLGGQNPFAAFHESAENMEYKNRSFYDALLNEALLDRMQEYCAGEADQAKMLESFIKDIHQIFPTLDTSELGAEAF